MPIWNEFSPRGSVAVCMARDLACSSALPERSRIPEQPVADTVEPPVATVAPGVVAVQSLHQGQPLNQGLRLSRDSPCTSPSSCSSSASPASGQTGGYCPEGDPWPDSSAKSVVLPVADARDRQPLSSNSNSIVVRPSTQDAEEVQEAEVEMPARRSRVCVPLEPASPERMRLVKALARVLTQLASFGKDRPLVATGFHAVKPPSLDIESYLARINHFFCFSEACLVLGIVYIDRLMKLHPEFVVSPLSIHRLVATSMSVAAKFFDDDFFANSYYSRVAGVRVSELNALEAQFLQMLGWRLHVTPEEYASYRGHFENVLPPAQDTTLTNTGPKMTLRSTPPVVNSTSHPAVAPAPEVAVRVVAKMSPTSCTAKARTLVGSKEVVASVASAKGDVFTVRLSNSSSKIAPRPSMGSHAWSAKPVT